jgi:antitoxin ParD1/3/4
MSTPLRITLPSNLRDWVQRQVSRKGYNTPSEYVRELLRLERLREVQERVDAKLLEALDSGPAVEMTAQDWEEIRTKGPKRAAARTRAKE